MSAIYLRQIASLIEGGLENCNGLKDMQAGFRDLKEAKALTEMLLREAMAAEPVLHEGAKARRHEGESETLGHALCRVARLRYSGRIPTTADCEEAESLALDARRRAETAGETAAALRARWRIRLEPLHVSHEVSEAKLDAASWRLVAETRENEIFKLIDERAKLRSVIDAIRLGVATKLGGCELIGVERGRQIAQEGWSPEHDDQHRAGELGLAAIVYADIGGRLGNGGELQDISVEDYAGASSGPWWPWEKEWFKPSEDPIRNLVKAGALIAAEIDRLRRIKSGEVAK